MTDRRDASRPGPTSSAGPGHLVLRNATWLVTAQLVAAPVSLLVNAVMGRYLGPGDFGTIYLAVTLHSI